MVSYTTVSHQLEIHATHVKATMPIIALREQENVCRPSQDRAKLRCWCIITLQSQVGVLDKVIDISASKDDLLDAVVEVEVTRSRDGRVKEGLE